MGFNSFVLLFLAINISTIGVEVNSTIPFLFGLGYLIYMSAYLSKGALWRVRVLLAIGLVGAFVYILGLVTSKSPATLTPLAIAHIVLSLILAAGAFADWRARRHAIAED